MTVTICGIPYTVETVPVIDEGAEGIVQGQIVYSKGKILIKQDMPKQIFLEVLTHEMIHGVLNHIGRAELADDESFVQGLTSGIFNSSFCLTWEGDDFND